MDYTTAGMVCLVTMMVLMVIGTPIAYSLGISSIAAGLIAFGPASLDKVGWSTFQLLYSLTWTTLPLFILMASLIAQTTIGRDLFNAASKWLSRIPGGLIAAGILGEGAMASIMATSGACIAAVGRVADPEYVRFGYNRGLAFGGLLCGGVLGPLIPPSSIMIIYAIFAECSIGQLFIAGIIPGIVLAVMLAGTAVFMCWRNPTMGPPQGAVPWKDRIVSLKGIWPVMLIMLLVLGAIYLGVATATEAGGFGVAAVLIVGIVLFKLRWKGIRAAMIEAATISGMIIFIIIGAQYFAYIVSSSGVGSAMANWVIDMNLSPVMVVVVINVLYLILGCFMDGLTVLMVTIPIFIPMIKAFDMSLIWFGVAVCVNMQIGLITPPFGVDLYLVQNMFKVPSKELIRGTMPFLIVLVVFLGLVISFPQMSLWLVDMMKG